MIDKINNKMQIFIIMAYIVFFSDHFGQTLNADNNQNFFDDSNRFPSMIDFPFMKSFSSQNIKNQIKRFKRPFQTFFKSSLVDCIPEPTTTPKPKCRPIFRPLFDWHRSYSLEDKWRMLSDEVLESKEYVFEYQYDLNSMDRPPDDYQIPNLKRKKYSSLRSLCDRLRETDGHKDDSEMVIRPHGPQSGPQLKHRKERNLETQNRIKRITSTTRISKSVKTIPLTTTSTTIHPKIQTTESTTTEITKNYTKSLFTIEEYSKSTESETTTDSDNDVMLRNPLNVTVPQELSTNSNLNTVDMHNHNETKTSTERSVNETKDIDDDRLLQMFSFIFNNRSDFIKTLLNNNKTFDKNSYEDIMRGFGTTEETIRTSEETISTTEKTISTSEDISSLETSSEGCKTKNNDTSSSMNAIKEEITENMPPLEPQSIVWKVVSESPTLGPITPELDPLALKWDQSLVEGSNEIK